MFEISKAKIVAQTDAAVLVESPDLEESTWFPQSQITDDSEVWKKGQEGTLIVTDWIAAQKGLI